MTSLRQLLERVKAAGGPDRELDVALVKLGFGVDAYPTAYKEWDWEFYTDEHPLSAVPKYTASIDAALSLVERKLPGWRTQMFELRAGRWIARLISPDWLVIAPFEPSDSSQSDAPSPALALLAALLSALIAQANHEGPAA